MSKAQHTSWEVQEFGDSLQIVSGTRKIAVMTWFNQVDEETNKEDKENARLIAAAPETAAERDKLREVNKELLEAMEAIVLSHHGEGGFEKARAAIAKALND